MKPIPSPLLTHLPKPKRLLAVLIAAATSLGTPLLRGTDIACTVDWKNITGATTVLSFGTCPFAGFDPVTTNDSNYKSNYDFMFPGLVRYHSWDMYQESTSPTSGAGWYLNFSSALPTWDAAKINNALGPLAPYLEKRIMLIPRWPHSWDDPSNTTLLASSHYTDFANQCASLVDIINVQQKRHFEYFEVLNEQEPGYIAAGKMVDFGTIFKQCYDAMKLKDSSIKVGGPAWTNAYDTTNIGAFGTQVSGKLDFFSVHAYGASGTTSSNTDAYNRAYNAAYSMLGVRSALDAHGCSGVPIFVDEYNICSVYDLDPQMSTVVSAIYDALTMKYMVERVNVASTASWNDRDAYTGKMNNDPASTLRPASASSFLANNYLIGNRVSTTPGINGTLEIWAIRSGLKKAIQYINRSGAPQTAATTFKDGYTPTSATYRKHQITSAGYTVTNTTTPLTSTLSLPTDSIFLMETVDYLNADVNSTLAGTNTVFDPNYAIGSTTGSYPNSVWGKFTITGAGTDIYNSADAFRFVYQPLSGDGAMVARVTSVSNTNQASKAGVMIRESLNANSPEFSVVALANNKCQVLVRTAAGGATTYQEVSGLAFPFWVKVTRYGSQFTGYYSTSGAPGSWTVIGSPTTVNMSTANIGLAVCSHNASALCTAVFDGIGTR